MIRKAIPLALIPLAIIAGGLAAVPWLHSFPPGVISVPVFGAAVLSPLVPVVAIRLGARKLWVSLLIDVACFFVYALTVTLHDPTGFSDVIDGIYRGPSQILTFALPLVSPRSLFVAPVALCWLAGMLAGECLTRRWFTVLPYPGFLVSYGLAYAGTLRAVHSGNNSSHVSETLITALLLATLLLMRIAQTWVREDETAESTQADGILPLRGLVVGGITTAVVALVAALVVQSSAFNDQATTPQRVPSVDDSRPLSPVSFIASIRPTDPHASGDPVFSVQTSAKALGYFGIANVDDYEGDGWTFQRTFRPSGGVLPADADTALKSAGSTVTQEYHIDNGPLVGVPWMPSLYRPQRVTGMSVNIDPDSGMIVPAGKLHNGQSYRVDSHLTSTLFGKLSKTASPDTGTSPMLTAIPSDIRAPLADLVSAFADETGTPSSQAIPFLQALQSDLQQKYSLTGSTPTGTSTSGAPTTGTSTTGAESTATPGAAATTSGQTAHRLAPPMLGPRAKPTSHPAKRPATHAKTTPHTTAPKPAPKTTPKSAPSPAEGSSQSVSPGARAGSTGFSDVYASIVGPDRTGTPEQYATLIALVARQLGVPARVVTGFRVVTANNSPSLPAGRYTVTTAQAWSWVEVPIVGVGWVVLDAAPGTYSSHKTKKTAQASPPPSPSAAPTQNALVTKSNNGHAVAKKSAVPHSPGASHKALAISLIIVFGALLLSILILLMTRKQLRRRRRQRAPDPRQRVLGAWSESIDVLTEAGLPDLTSLTSEEISALTAAQFGPDPASQAGYIGHAANTAIYSTSVLVGPRDAESAWQAERALRKQISRQLGFRGRLAAWLRYHRGGHPQRPVGPRSWADETADRGHEPRRRAPRLRVPRPRPRKRGH